jgi:hypothetical protein
MPSKKASASKEGEDLCKEMMKVGIGFIPTLFCSVGAKDIIF